MYSTHSAAAPRLPHQPSAQLSTTTLLNALHSSYTSGRPYGLEASTSVAVNTWVTALNEGVVDAELGRRAWEHARRRAEDGCIILGSSHDSTPSLLVPFVSTLPLSVPASFYTAYNALRPFLFAVTPKNPSCPRYTSLAATLTLSLTGDLTGASFALSASGIDTKTGLTQLPPRPGHRAFDVFYYLLQSATAKEREYLELRDPSTYSLLRKSETFQPPSYLPTADDAASAEDFRDSLKAIGIKGASLRSLFSVLAAILKLGDVLGFLVDEDVLENTCEEVAGLLEIEPDVLLRKCDTTEREILIGSLYEAVVDWVITKANDAIRTELRNGVVAGSSSDSDAGLATPPSSNDDGDSVSITVLDIPHQTLAKAIALRTVFDDTTGINAEMKEDGVPVHSAGSSVIREMTAAVTESEADLGLQGGVSARDREADLDRREGVLEKVGSETEESSFIRRILYPISGEGILLGKAGRINIPHTLASSRVWFHLALHPTDDAPSTLANLPAGMFPWSAGSVSSQIRALRLPEWANYRNKQLDYTADFDHAEFVDRYSRLGCQAGRDGIESWIMERGWSNGEVIVGSERVWIRESAWWEAESMLDLKPVDDITPNMGPFGNGYQVSTPNIDNGFYASPFGDQNTVSRENLLDRSQSMAGKSMLGARSLAPTKAPTVRTQVPGDYGLGSKGDDKRNEITYYGELDPEIGDGKHIIEEPVTFGRRAWVATVWTLTFWIPSPLLRYVGGMKRPDVRLAWREKLVLVGIIFFINALVVFWIVEFGRLLCPNSDKAWNAQEVSEHQGNNDFYVSFRGGVYDISKFWRIQHSDIAGDATTSANMQPFAGTDVSEYIVPPLSNSCAYVTDPTIIMQANNSITYPAALHSSGPIYQTNPDTKLHDINWYYTTFLPAMKEYYKGDLVYTKKDVLTQGQNDQRYWFILNNKIYDMTDYFYTLNLENNLASFNWLPDDVVELVQSNPGEDISASWNSQINATTRYYTQQCLDNVFYAGIPDFRDSIKCQINNYLLLAFTIIICSVILTKFLAALQFGSKRRPAMQDKFVICQVPAYTEGEDHLRKGLDSLTALAYDNKRKLICVICDGMIVGGGNDRPTPKIVLDILGVDPKIDPPALPFKSVGQGSEQLNYGKVYSGLYEFEGNVVPYIVIVKVGKESEQSKSRPGNRGKRDSQILLMSFLNRVHHRSPMSPLELEMFHQINNIIGVDPELYEYLLMVDADTLVKEDSLNRLVASCANDAKIAGICGETSLENEDHSWTTMIQVYEYYISHHLSKAFESLFGSVTCLPGW